MIDAKLKGEGIDREAEPPQVATSNVVDLMAALKKSLSQIPEETKAPARRKKADVTSLVAPPQAASASRKRLIRLWLCPGVDTHPASLLLKANDAIGIGFRDEVADLIIAETAVRALKVHDRHTGPPACRGQPA
jgi:hypothetical protein